MYLSEILIESIRQVLVKKGINERLRIVQPVAGGSINNCFKMQAGEEHFFLKVNSLEKYPRMFLAEAEGLKLIRKADTVRVPEMIAHGAAGAEQFLLLEWIEAGKNTSKSQETLGRQLAGLHRHSNENFGLEYDNYMGSLPQKNSFHTSWTDFYIAERLQPQLKMAVDAGLVSLSLENDFENLFSRLADLYPKERPALIHGDLWGGNYMIAASGEPVLIDPAAAYGHCEVDIAMTVLFGGFNEEFYRSYNENYPLEKGWEGRLDLWNLYPLLVHVNLFGAGYLGQLRSCLKKYAR